MKNLHLLPTDKPKQETLKELALKNSKYINHSNINYSKQEAIILDAKWMQERMYSEKEVFRKFDSNIAKFFILLILFLSIICLRGSFFGEYFIM